MVSLYDPNPQNYEKFVPTPVTPKAPLKGLPNGSRAEIVGDWLEGVVEKATRGDSQVGPSNAPKVNPEPAQPSHELVRDDKKEKALVENYLQNLELLKQELKVSSHFELGSAKLDAEAEVRIDSLAKKVAEMQKNPVLAEMLKDLPIEVHGHADRTPPRNKKLDSHAYNQELSEQRAEALAMELNERIALHGGSALKIETVGHSFDKAKDKYAMETRNRDNRRADAELNLDGAESRITELTRKHHESEILKKRELAPATPEPLAPEDRPAPARVPEAPSKPDVIENTPRSVTPEAARRVEDPYSPEALRGPITAQRELEIFGIADLVHQFYGESLESAQKRTAELAKLLWGANTSQEATNRILSETLGEPVNVSADPEDGAHGLFLAAIKTYHDIIRGRRPQDN